MTERRRVADRCTAQGEEETWWRGGVLARRGVILLKKGLVTESGALTTTRQQSGGEWCGDSGCVPGLWRGSNSMKGAHALAPLDTALHSLHTLNTLHRRVVEMYFCFYINRDI
mmetsp:Transcript_9384/g.15702  ORF Transcript_9384/g.15702 Transcript_9384/m.15702 type:complete len:113 (+) Transcript_9384:2595-2933(+)